MNQARSPFAQATLSKHFPELTVASAGVKAVTGTNYLPEVVGVARRWGINLASGFSRSLAEVNDLLDFDLVISAEEAMMRDVALLGYHGTSISYEQVISDTSFMPRDPAGLSGRYMQSELAKVAFVNIRAVRNFLNITPANPIIAVMPETESNIETSIDWAIAESTRLNAILIDADLRVPLRIEFKKRGLQIGGFSQIHAQEKFDAFSSIAEQLQPEKLFLDDWWTKTINEIASTRPVVMITAPQIIASGPLPDPYLATIAASEIQVIRR